MDTERRAAMTVTAVVKAELCRVRVLEPSERRAELATVLCLAGSVHLVGGRIVVEAVLDSSAVAGRVSRQIADVFGYPCQVHPILGDRAHPVGSYLLRVSNDGAGLARQLGLVDRRGRAVIGVPHHVLTGGSGVAAAAWRGAFLASGWLSEPGRPFALELACPSVAAALAMRGAARRLGVEAKLGQGPGGQRVLVRDGELIEVLLTRIGAQDSTRVWTEARIQRQVRSTAHRPVSFGEANRRRSARAAAAAGARVERALAILGEDAPRHLLQAGHLRMQHEVASLDQLGALSDPPMSKDTIAGRLRRLVETADRRAAELAIPNTNSTPARDTPTS